MKNLKFPINIYAKLYFKINDFFANHELFGHYWVKKIETVDKYYRCPYCHKMIYKKEK